MLLSFAVLWSAVWTQCSTEPQRMFGSRIADGTPVARCHCVGQASLETNHLEILPSEDRQNSEFATQFPIGYRGLQEEVYRKRSTGRGLQEEVFLG